MDQRLGGPPLDGEERNQQQRPTPGQPQPAVEPKLRANNSPVTPRVRVIAPGKSMRCRDPAGRGGSRRKRPMSAIASKPNGTLTKKIQGQLMVVTISPPSTGPTTLL